MSSRREDCPLCGGDIYPDHAQGTATNTETGVNFMVCVHCDGATHTPLPDNADKWKQSRGVLKPFCSFDFSATDEDYFETWYEEHGKYYNQDKEAMKAAYMAGAK